MPALSVACFSLIDWMKARKFAASLSQQDAPTLLDTSEITP